MLKYKGYIGVLEYDSHGKVFTGEVTGVRSVLTFHGSTAEEVEDSFKKTIDLYLEMCKEDGITPEKPFSGRFNVRIPPSLHHDIAIRAAVEKKSLNDWAIEAFQKAIDQ